MPGMDIEMCTAVMYTSMQKAIGHLKPDEKNN